MRHRGIQAKSRVGLAVAVFIAVVLGGCAGKPERFEFTRLEMGVRARIVTYARSRDAAEAGAQGAFARIAALDACMSDYRAESELMRLCAAASGRPVPVSSDLFDVLEAAQRLSRASDGAFDVTVGPLVALWREARRTGQLPSPESLRAARERVDWRSVMLDPKAHTVTLTRGAMKLDLGGIAKGYAAQRAVDVLRSKGLTRSLVALAGDICVGDPPPGEKGWKIDIGPPAPAPGPDGHVCHCRTLIIANACISTSGDSVQFVQIEGKRYSHIIDPRTGVAMTTSVQATVVGRDGAVVDAAGTALSVMGPANASALSEALGVSSIVTEGGAMILSDRAGELRWSR